ncbi:signal recognition particle-docking protein FtsY [Breoghania sp. L-A4]|uniref:signal recognition particle-docking protein FtsY n=1 Tax=Breoghania sp. L-A4 TaxID=2304600 RepID=UPI000E35D23C|nr:signal recognition particle-docking protein FtsY [Breoghania sp. L-A4]AXS42264.1 signal recognition particle-docking protein FtsY [Breoghania sp. L-A4]
MADIEKRGLFSRLFKGSERPVTPETDTQDADPAAEVLATEAPATQTLEPAGPADVATDAAVEIPAAEEAAAAPLVTDAALPQVVDEAIAEALEADPPSGRVVTDDTDAEPAEDATGNETPESEKRSWFQRLKQGLSRSSSALSDNITGVFRKRKLDDAALEELEDILIQADLGVETAMAITERLAEGRYDKEISGEEVKAVLAEEVEKVLAPVALPLDLDSGHKPHVVLMVGVNGTGKTTTIGKLAAKLTSEGKTVMMAAGDTFRAAAVEQLKIWGARTGSTVVSRDTGADAAGLAFEALQHAVRDGVDVLLIDTAGRLQNRAELMAELEKVVRVIKKQMPDAPHTVLLTLDATTGQNAVQQVEIFGRTAGVTGLVMTKLDGTARGGILVAIAAKFGLPVHFIGVGEGINDLEPFSASDFAKAIVGGTE